MGTLLITGATAYTPELEEDANGKFYRGGVHIDYISSGDFSNMTKEEVHSAVFLAFSKLEPIKV